MPKSVLEIQCNSDNALFLCWYKPQDEWVVCRVFMKSSGGKKYSSNQPRATNPYTIDMGPAMMPSLLQAAADPYHHHFGVGRNHLLTPAELGELARFAKGQPGFSLPIQPQLNFPGSFTLSGLNLNLGAQQQQVLRPMPVPLAQQQQHVAAEPALASSVLTNCILAADGGFNGDVNNTAAGARFQHVDPCVDLEGYWPAY